MDVGAPSELSSVNVTIPEGEARFHKKKRFGKTRLIFPTALALDVECQVRARRSITFRGLARPHMNVTIGGVTKRIRMNDLIRMWNYRLHYPTTANWHFPLSLIPKKIKILDSLALARQADKTGRLANLVFQCHFEMGEQGGAHSRITVSYGEKGPMIWNPLGNRGSAQAFCFRAEERAALHFLKEQGWLTKCEDFDPLSYGTKVAFYSPEDWAEQTKYELTVSCYTSHVLLMFNQAETDSSKSTLTLGDDTIDTRTRYCQKEWWNTRRVRRWLRERIKPVEAGKEAQESDSA